MIDIEVLGKVIESLNVGVVVLNPQNEIIAFNRKAGEFLQQDSETRIGTSILRCHPERAEAGVLKMIDQMKSGELESYEGFVNFCGRIVYEYIYPIRDERGNYIATVSEIHDGADKAEALKLKGEFTQPEMHGLGESAPRAPQPD
jgi:DUF438 domain-containing protein